MENTIVCPVCHISLPAGTMKCPDCGNDLSVLVYFQREADVLFNKALAQYQEGHVDEAITTLNYLLQKFPDDVRAVNLLGKLYANQGRGDRALALWQAASDRLPEEESIRANLAVVEEQQERQKTAAEAARLQAGRSARTRMLLSLGGMFLAGLLVLFLGQRLFGGAAAAAPAPTSAPLVLIVTATPLPPTAVPTAIPTTAPTAVPTAIPTPPPTPTPDLLPAALAALAQNPKFAALNLAVTQKEGRVLAVTGEIHNIWERFEIESVLHGVEGVEAVDLKGLTFGKFYVVQAGDTLSGISQKMLGDWRQWPRIVEVNQMQPPYPIRAGQELKIPGPQ